MSAPTIGTGVDRELALSRVGGDAELLKEIAVLFLEDYPKLLAELRSAAARGDARNIEHAAHGLKGSVSNFGARAAVEAAWTLERMGREKQLSGAGQPEVQPDLQSTLHSLEDALEMLRPELEAL